MLVIIGAFVRTSALDWGVYRLDVANAFGRSESVAHSESPGSLLGPNFGQISEKCVGLLKFLNLRWSTFSRARSHN